MRDCILTPSELVRYSRNLILPEINIEGQKKLKNSKVLVVGAGGLGAPLLLYLTAAGVGNIGIVDFDVIDESNLQRQVLFATSEVSQKKVDIARNKLNDLNPHVQIKTYPTQLTSENAIEVIRDYDVVADGSDNFPTRYLVNDACVMLGKTNVYASIFRFEGQVSVFNYLDKNGLYGPNYRDLFPTPPPPGMVPSCAEGGVLGVLPGIIGCMQANEVIKVITKVGNPLSGRLFLFDALNFESRTLKVRKDKNTPLIDKLIDYEAFCGQTNDHAGIQEMDVFELKKMIDDKVDFQLIDVREPYEFDVVNINGILIPKDELEHNIDAIQKEIPVVLHCRSGKRSADSVRLLNKKYGFTNLFNLKGGILTWIDQVDPQLPKY
ncbi:MAG TPA: molybdopterin-synthase adenylyltransferase MoeB [Cyclobacteriaceae bacterium]